MRFLLHGFHPILQEKLSKKVNSVLTISDKNRADFSILEINHDPFSFNLEEFNFNEYIKFYLFAKNEFPRFCDIYSRNFLNGGISQNDYENFFSQMCKIAIFLRSKFSFNYVLFSNIPHEGFDWVLYKLVQFYNIKYLVTYDSVFPNKFYISSNLETIFKQDKKNDDALILPSNHKLEVEKPFYMKSTFRGGLLKRKIVLIKCYIKNPKLFIDDVISYVKNILYKIRYNLIKSDVIDLENISYVYFPLHFQPELATTSLADEFSDQLLAIEALRGIVPSEIKILIKENPIQGSFKRSATFFKRLKTIKNVDLISIKISTIDLTKNSLFVSTLNGTAAFEAIKLNKPALVFGNPWYQSLPGIFRYDNSNVSQLFNKIMTFKGDSNLGILIEIHKNGLLDGFVDIDYFGNLDSKIRLNDGYEITANSLYNFIISGS